MTTIQARDGGREVYGFPKFVADMDFVEEITSRRVELCESGSTIFSLAVRPGGPVLPDRRSLALYSVLNSQLVETIVPVQGHMQARIGSRAGTLTLGSHPVAERLRALEISPHPVMAFSYLDNRSMLPAGRSVGAARSYSGYLGSERPFGRFTVSYPDTTPQDQYAFSAVPTP